MKTLLITFAVLLIILTLISALGGSLKIETFEDEYLPEVQQTEVVDEYPTEMPSQIEQPMTQENVENFWEEQQKSLMHNSYEGFNQCGYKEKFQQEPEYEEPQFNEGEEQIEPFEASEQLYSNV
jgi:uncharacterized membrane protein YraQ (UPF0718 family)